MRYCQKTIDIPQNTEYNEKCKRLHFLRESRFAGTKRRDNLENKPKILRGE